MKTVRIGSGSGMWPDRTEPALEIIEKGNVGYIAFDTMAEITLPTLHKRRLDDPSKGYTEVRRLAERVLPACARNKVKLICNAGGANPQAATALARDIASKCGLRGMRIATVTGDDTIGDAARAHMDELRAGGVDLKHSDTGQDIAAIKDKVIGMSIYLGAAPIVEALGLGADMAITGRNTDSSLWLAPLAYEFGWPSDDWDRLGRGILVAHLLECSGQVTGGNYGDWRRVPSPERLGFPIAEVSEDGDAIITKVEGSGGMVTVDICREQLLYEIHDPTSYLTPDVVADFSQVRLEQAGKDRVNISGARGRPRPGTLKASISYHDGYVTQAFIFYAWPDAYDKAKRAAEILQDRFKVMGLNIKEMRTDFVGVNALHGPLATPARQANEVMLRLAIRADKERDLTEAIRDVYALELSGPQGAGGAFHIGPSAMVGLWTALIPRELVTPKVEVSVVP